jgi:hypothetical protein
MRHHTNRRARAGFTLLEILIASSLLLFILGVSTQFLRRQTNAVSGQSGRLDAQQNAHFSLSTLERELRVAGIGVVDQQPIIVQAAPLAMTFNGDLVSRVKGDPGAVYIDVDADSDAVEGFRSRDAVKLPNSNVPYPDSTYMKGPGVLTNAETIAFWLAKDSSSNYANEYILYRRVNNLPQKVVARGIVVNATDTVFQYFKIDTAGVLRAISTAALPLYHTAKTHGATSDTGRFAIVDSIKLVRIRMTSVYHDRKGDVTRRLETTIRIMNAGLIRRTTCGDPPIGVTPVAATSAPFATSPFVNITWARSLDETQGEKDIERYAIFRRLSTAPDFSEPIASIPAGSATYTFTDTNVRFGESWVYGVTAQDCTPASSGIGSTATVIIP